MGPYGDQAYRLLRADPWKTPQELAEEIFAIWTARIPTISGPIQIVSQPDGIPPLTIDQPFDPGGFTVPPVVIRGPSGDTTPLSPPPPPGPPPPPPPPGVPPSTGGNAFVGVVGGGSGFNYTCTLTGADGTTFTASVRMANLAADAKLKSGIEIPVIGVSGVYTGFPAVYYEG